MMRKMIYTMLAAGALCILTAGCASNGAPSSTATAENTMDNQVQIGSSADQEARLTDSTVTVTATGSINVTPDMALVTMGIVTEESTAAEAQLKSDETVNHVTEKLKELGVEEKSIQTTGYYMNQQYDYNSNTVTGYRVDVSLTVKDRKVDEVGEVISACTAAGANQFHGITMSSSEYDSAYEQALKDAVHESESKARILAEAAGKQIAGVASITEGYQDTSARYRSTNMYVEAAAEEAASADMAVMAGELTVSAPVTVVYILE